MKHLSLVATALFLTPVLAFRILIQPTTSVGAPTTVLWVKNASDPSPLTDLRFVITIDGKDEPLKKASANFNVNTPGGSNSGVHSLGKESFVFQNAGKYQVKAIFGEDDKLLGTSNEVTVSEVPASSPASPAQAAASSAGASRKSSNKSPIIAGAVLGALLILLILVVLVRFLLHRRQLQREKDRLSFHPEQMIQRRRSLWMDGAQGGSVIEGGAVVVERPENPFAGGINFTIDVEAGRRESVINPFRDPPRSAMPSLSIEPVSQSTRPENPFRDPSSTRDHTAPLDSSVKATGNPASVAYLETGVGSMTGSAAASPAITPSRHRSIKTARPAPTRPLPTPFQLLHKGKLPVPRRDGSKNLPHVPLSAPVHQTEFNVEMPPSPLTPSRSKPQRLMDRRLEQVQSQLDILRRRRQREGVDEEVASKIEEDLERKADWLRKEIVRGWSADVEEDDLVLPGEDVKTHVSGSARV